MKNANFICTVCGFIGKPKKQSPGSFGVEVILWFIFILPGLLYSLWRLSAKRSVCRKCKSNLIIPVNTPKGQELSGQNIA